MTIIKTYSRLSRNIRHLTRIIKNAKNEAKAYRDEATYHQAVLDDVKEKYGLSSKLNTDKGEGC